MNDPSFMDLIKLYQGDKKKPDICFFSLCLGSDISFYDKECVEDGNFAWSDYKLGNTVFIDPAQLYEKDILKVDLFRFTDYNSGEDSKEKSIEEQKS